MMTIGIGVRTWYLKSGSLRHRIKCRVFGIEMNKAIKDAINNGNEKRIGKIIEVRIDGFEKNNPNDMVFHTEDILKDWRK